jgi:putative transposase
MKRGLRSHWHCIYSLHYHLVLVTKYRRKCFTQPMLERLKQICENTCALWDIECLEFGGETDHIHLLLSMHPNVMPSRFVNNLKTVTSRLIRQEYKKHLSHFYRKPVLWTRAYCLISAEGAPLAVLKKYIEKQEKSEK